MHYLSFYPEDLYCYHIYTVVVLFDLSVESMLLLYILYKYDQYIFFIVRWLYPFQVYYKKCTVFLAVTFKTFKCTFLVPQNCVSNKQHFYFQNI